MIFQSNTLLVLLAASTVLLAGADAQYSYGQATYYNSIENGYCGFGKDIPSNGFVAAWPFIETGPKSQGYPQPGTSGQGCGACMEVSCVPQFVESADGSIYLDRRDACADPNRAVVVRIVDECRCSLPRDSNLPRGNFNWCCNTPTPKLGINRHIDLSQQAFSALVKGGEYGLGIIGIRWRPTSCSRIGVVSINGGGDAPRPTPATSPAAAKAPERPSKPPTGNDWHSVDGMHTEERRENTQELPLLSQCGGMGGACGKFGPGNMCKDRTFNGYSCAKGLVCERQSKYYHQCVSPDRNNVDNGRNTAQASSNKTPADKNSSSAPKRRSNAKKTLQETEQCGGKGGKCVGDLCADKAFPGYTCDKGLACTRQNEWWWQCDKKAGSNASGSDKADSSIEKPSPAKEQAAGQQCGGLGADCDNLGGCIDGPLSNVKCAPGLSCRKQNKNFWECRA